MNPALKDLEVLVGTWDVELTFPADRSNINHATMSFEWLEEGNFLLQRFPVEAGAPMRSRWLIGRDDSVDTYTVLYADSRGVSRVYQMSFKNSEWKMWRDAPGFAQRFMGAISENKNIIAAKWEKSTDGSTWEVDFNLTYTRVR